MNWWTVILSILNACLPPKTPPISPELPITEVLPPPPPLDPPNVVLMRQAQVWIGRDPSTPDLANDELGCADSCSKIIRTLYPNFPHTVSTITLFNQLKASKHFKATLTPKLGCVIISPRVGAQAGHCGIFLTDTKIMSNDSRNGLWQQNYTFTSWVAYFKKKKGLRVFIFQPI